MTGFTMQPIELTALVLFLLSYAGSALMAVLRPSAYRASEIQFYTTGRLNWDETVVFVFGGFAFLAAVAHLIVETPRLGEILLYVQCLLFVALLPFHFMPFLRARMKSTLGQKTVANYKSSGMRKLAVAVIMIILPLVVHR